MLRPIAVIVAAITLSRPEMDVKEAERYAQVLQKLAKDGDFDPLSGVSIVHFESGWYPDVVSKNGEDHGLAQIRARFVGACRNDPDPVNAPSEACLAEKRRLLDPAENLREMAGVIARNRELCKDKTGSAWFHQWLAAYQGRNFPKENKWCQPGDKTWQVVKYRRKLVAELLVNGKLKQEHKARLAELEKQQRKRAKNQPREDAQRD